MACSWRIRHKLMLGLGLVVALMGLLLTGTLKGLLSYRSTMRSFDSRLDELEKADELRAAVKALQDVPADSKQQKVLVNEKIPEARARLAAYEEKLDNSLSGNHVRDQGIREKGQVQYIRKHVNDLTGALTSTGPEIIGPTFASSINLLTRPHIKEPIDKLVSASLDLITFINEDLQIRIKNSRQDRHLAIGIVTGTSVVGVLLMLGLLRWFYRWVFYPIRDLNLGVERVARGDFEHKIEVHSGDEIEDLSKAFNDMTGRLREMYGELAHKVNERSRQLVRSERLAGVGFLAAGIAHEINNPLAGIAFCSEALETRLADLLAERKALAVSDQDRDIITKYLKMIQEEAFRCKEIIQRLLDFSRGGERRREPTELGELIQSVIDMVHHLPNSRGKQIVCSAGGATDRIIAWVNSQEIKSVVLNLVVNALDSMDEGGTLTIGRRERAGSVELVFQDTGCGMTPEILENIFEPFFSRSRTGKGTGLGLSISHRIITQHGGEIEATSAGPGNGSTFVVRLPLRPPDEQRENPEVLDPETEFNKLAGKPKRQAA